MGEGSGQAMKRDMYLIREILFAVERDEGFVELSKKYGEALVAGHAAILKDAGLVEAKIFETSLLGVPCAAHIFRLTWNGHEFLDNARDNAIWKKTLKEIGSKAASVSFKVLTACLEAAMRQQLGLP